MTTRKVIALLVVALFIATGLTVLASGAGEQSHSSAFPTASAAATSQSILPNPVMNSNITWSTFYSGWNPLEYSNGSANLTLNTGFSQLYQNPITINPTHIHNSVFLAPLGTSTEYWNKTYSTYPGGTQTINAQAGKISITSTSLDTSTTHGSIYWNISTAYIPSLNPAYDYVTLILTSQQTGTGNAGVSLGIGNGTSWAGNIGATTEILNETPHEENRANIPTTGDAFISMQASQYVKNFASEYMQIGIFQNLPETTTSGSLTVTTTVLGLLLTSYPVSLGTFTNASGVHPITAMETTGNQNLASSFSPNFQWSSITNNSYTVATSQPLQNTITSQTAINENGYSEQVSYQGTEYLPTAPYLTYSSSNVTMQMNVSGTQYNIANLNGVSYLSAIQAKHNGTFLFALVNPNQQNSIILQLDYTTSQWNSVSGAPPFFSLAGLEYYWWVGLIGFFSLIGLGSAALAHWGGAEENLRAPKGKFGR